jgi:hypothetical protein
MHQLPTHFRHDGFTYTQLARIDDIALYEQRTSPEICAYEVIRVQHRQAKKLPSGAIAEAGEYYPSTSTWGFAGWTHRRLEKAQAHMARLVDEARAKAQQQGAAAC